MLGGVWVTLQVHDGSRGLAAAVAHAIIHCYRWP
jgi:hypothetical protein